MSPRPETPTRTRDLVLPAVQPSVPVGGQFLNGQRRPNSGGRPRSAGRTAGRPAAPQAILGGPMSAPPLRGPCGGDNDIDSMLYNMESHLSQLKAKQAQAAVSQGQPFAGPLAVRPPQVSARALDGNPNDQDLDAMLSKMESHLHTLKKKKAEEGQQQGPQVALPDSPPKNNMTDGPVSDADLDAALSHMEGHIQKIKAHKKVKDAQPHWGKNEEPLVPLDMPHWEHHKYGHHKITEPAWKPEAQINDMYGHQHSAAEYGYNNYGAGSHSHHLAHYHLNDYHGLAHHEFKKEEYHRQQHGTGSHSHWVPHLHGVGTSSHHGEHSYKKEEYGNAGYGKEEHNHWVPHLHGIGSSHH